VFVVQLFCHKNIIDLYERIKKTAAMSICLAEQRKTIPAEALCIVDEKIIISIAVLWCGSIFVNSTFLRRNETNVVSMSYFLNSLMFKQWKRADEKKYVKSISSSFHWFESTAEQCQYHPDVILVIPNNPSYNTTFNMFFLVNLSLKDISALTGKKRIY